MEGIKEAIAYITGLAVKAEDPKTVEINGKTYCTKDLVRYDAPEKAAPISATTLTSLVDYIKENREELRDRMIIQVVNETKVLLYSGLLAERDRETLFEVNALLPRFEYGREYDQESFLISMQSCFKESDDREAVTMLASNIVNTQEATFSDNGTTQQAVMKTGITTKDNVLVPNPVNLIPYRTFLEVEQPASDFVFRVSEGRGGAPVFKLVASGSLRRWQMSRRTSWKHSKTYRTETRSQSLHNVTDINVGIIKGGPCCPPAYCRRLFMELLKSPFLNDPSSLVAQAFAEIYPGTEYEAILVDKITTEDGTEMVGCTTFPDDGTLPLIEVAGHIPAEAVPEILAHELAHIVTVGDEHGPEWKKAFEAIYSKYNELAIARFGAQEPEENQKGGD